MKPTTRLLSLSALLTASALFLAPGCATTSEEAQRSAVTHQYKSEKAAESGLYGVAADEQRKAADDHHDAVKKAIDEGKPIPSQPQLGAGNPDGGT